MTLLTYTISNDFRTVSVGIQTGGEQPFGMVVPLRTSYSNTSNLIILSASRCLPFAQERTAGTRRSRAFATRASTDNVAIGSANGTFASVGVLMSRSLSDNGRNRGLVIKRPGQFELVLWKRHLTFQREIPSLSELKKSPPWERPDGRSHGKSVK